jgi:hypothetical protein
MVGGRWSDALLCLVLGATGCADLLGAEFEPTSVEAAGGSAGAGGAGGISEGGVDADATGEPDSTSDAAAEVAFTYQVDEGSVLSPLALLGCESNCGEPFAPVECPTGEVVTGIRINWAGPELEVPSALTLRCSRVAPSGAIGPAHDVPPALVVFGSVTGEESAVDDCGKDEVAVGLYGYARNGGGTDYVGALGLRCARLVDWMAGTGSVVPLPLRGSPLGTLLVDDCASGSAGGAVRRLTGHVGALFDGIRGHCIAIIAAPLSHER